MQRDLSYPVSYFILDAARTGSQLEMAREMNKNHLSLYSDKNERYLAQVAPYIFTVPVDPGFSSWVREHGWRRAWGIFVSADISLENLYFHFRKFVRVQTQDGEEFYFRFYDPRVLKMFLPTCDKKQVIEFFGPVKSFTVEGDTKNEAVRFWHENGLLKQQELTADEIFGEKVI